LKNPDKKSWQTRVRGKSIPCEQLKEFLKTNGVEFIPELRKKNTESKIILGGNHASASPERMFELFPIDYVIVGEGELTLSKLLEKIEGKKYLLPTHPFTDKQLIFVPHSFLRVLPIATSYDEIAQAATHNNELRKRFDDIVFSALEDVIKDASNKNEDEIKQFKKDIGSLLEIYQKIEVRSYDLKRDDRGYYNIDPFVEKESQNIKARKKPASVDELTESVRDLINQFKRSIEDNGGNNLLYRRTDTGKVDKNKPHHEDVAQRIFYLIADLFCQQADILLSGESDSGKGPVDFSLGRGYTKKVLVEIKKSNNSNIEDGFKKQIESYQKSENAMHSFYVVIIVKEQKERNGYISQLETIINLYEKNKKNNIKCPELIIVDGLIHPSPSKLKSKEDEI
jgi:hypothetical protein